MMRLHQPHQTRCRGLTLILPAFNEEATIATAIQEADAALSKLADAYEILVIDDGSTDGTRQLVEGVCSHLSSVRLIRHDENQGYGAALRTGFEASRFELVAFTDSDCQFHLSDLAALISATTEAPIAIGFRVERKDKSLRRFASWGYNRLSRLLLGSRAHDCDCALKVFRREVLNDLLPETEGFFVNSEMLTQARLHGHKIIEIGVRHRPRLAGRSTVSWSQIPRTLATILPFWWSRVLFPKPESSVDQNPASRWGLPLVLLIAIILFFSQLGAPLLEPQESRYAEIPRQMLANQEWLTPTLDGQAYLDKPPMLYWMVMSSFSVFGPTERAARMIPALAGVMTICVVFLWGRRAINERAGLCAALVLCLSVRFLYLGRMLSFDILLAFFVVASLALAHLAIRQQFRWRLWIGSAVLAAFGILTKGPIALLLILAPVMVFAFLDRRIATPRWKHWLSYFAVVLLVASPWFILMCLRHPTFAHEFFWRHHVLRFVAPFDHQEPVWFFLPGLILGMLPWTLLLPGLLRFVFRRSRRVASRRPVALGFFLLAFLWGFLFFSLSGCKRAVYILPVLPFLALSLGCYFDYLLPQRVTLFDAIWRPLRRSILARRATLLVLALGWMAGLVGLTIKMFTPGTALIMMIVPLIGLVLLLGSRARHVSWGRCGLATFVMLFLGVQLALPDYNRRFALKRCAQAQRSVAKHVPVISYPQQFSSIGFYLQREVRAYSTAQRDELIRDAEQHPRSLLFVKTGRSMKGLIKALPSTLEFREQDRQGKVVVGWIQQRNSTQGAIAQLSK